MLMFAAASSTEPQQGRSAAQQRWSRPEVLAVLLLYCQAEEVDMQDDEELASLQHAAVMTFNQVLQCGLPLHLLPPAGDRCALQLGVDCAYVDCACAGGDLHTSWPASGALPDSCGV